MKKILLWYQYLSIDVIAGALCSMFFVSRLIGITLTVKYYLLLTIAVYLIYLTDHLSDAFFSVVVDNERNHFYRKHFWLFILSGFMLGVVGVILSFQLPNNIQLAGYLLGLFSILYQLGTHFFTTKKWFFKELIIAVIYTLALWSIPVLVATISFKELIPAALPFFVLVFCNVLTFSLYQQKADWANGRHSLVHCIGSKPSKRLLVFLLSGIIVYASIAYTTRTEIIPLPVMLLYQVMSLFMGFIILYPERVKSGNRYAYLIDSLFILPLIAGLFL